MKTLKEEGNALYKQKSFEAALEKYRAALALDPNNIQLHNNVSAVLLEEGKFAESVANSQQAIELGAAGARAVRGRGEGGRGERV